MGRRIYLGGGALAFLSGTAYGLGEKKLLTGKISG